MKGIISNLLQKSVYMLFICVSPPLYKVPWASGDLGLQIYLYNGLNANLKWEIPSVVLGLMDYNLYLLFLTMPFWIACRGSPTFSQVLFQ